jgi:hypothetical protein
MAELRNFEAWLASNSACRNAVEVAPSMGGLKH